MNHRYFEKRGMRPLFVEEIAVHPSYHGMGIGSFMFEQIEHAARLRGCTHIVLEVAENNEEALRFYRKRNFHKLDAAIFLSRKLETAADLLEPAQAEGAREAGVMHPTSFDGGGDEHVEPCVAAQSTFPWPISDSEGYGIRTSKEGANEIAMRSFNRVGGLPWRRCSGHRPAFEIVVNAGSSLDRKPLFME